MRYRSNLECPSIRLYFKLREPPKKIMGHECPSDPDFLPDCCFLSDDEAAILFSIAKAYPGYWVDVGSRLGFSGAHIAAGVYAGRGENRVCRVIGVDCIDPEYTDPAFLSRFDENVAWIPDIGTCVSIAVTSEAYFAKVEARGNTIDAAHIDGNHDSPEPTLDAMRAIKAGAHVLVWHDFWGQPVADAVNAVIDLGWKCRIYNTPNGMACCWNTDEFTPPDHVPDPLIDWVEVRSRMPGFDFGRTI